MDFLLLFGLSDEAILEELRDDPSERFVTDVGVACVQLIKADQWMTTDVGVDLNDPIGELKVGW